MEIQKIILTSSAFEDGGVIPPKYTCEGDNTSPPLAFQDVPKGVRSLILVMEDPDIPQAVKESAGIQIFDHWIMFDIPPDTIEIPEGRPVGTEGLNSREQVGYTGPCPPSQFEPKSHRYFFRAYGLDRKLSLKEGVTKDEVLEAMKDHVIAEGALVGTYEKTN